MLCQLRNIHFRVRLQYGQRLFFSQQLPWCAPLFFIEINLGLHQRLLHFCDMGGSLRNQRLGRQRIRRHLVASRAPVRNLLRTATLLLRHFAMSDSRLMSTRS